MRRNKPYWLCDGIYPAWPVFIDSIMNAVSHKQRYFAKRQEAARKDIERAFGVLQAMWHIIAMPSRFESIEKMQTVMRCVVILHNMMVEDRSFEDVDEGEEFGVGIVVRETAPPMWEGLVRVSTSRDVSPVPGSLAARCALEQFKTNASEKNLTKRLLVDHLWAQHGDI